MKSLNEVGFSQRIKLEWLEYTAGLALAGLERKKIVEELRKLLREQISIGGSAERSNREKVISILIRIWINGPAELKGLREEGKRLLRGAAGGERTAIHWGMSMAAYPFFGRVMEIAG